MFLVRMTYERAFGSARRSGEGSSTRERGATSDDRGTSASHLSKLERELDRAHATVPVGDERFPVRLDPAADGVEVEAERSPWSSLGRGLTATTAVLSASMRSRASGRPSPRTSCRARPFGLTQTVIGSPVSRGYRFAISKRSSSPGVQLGPPRSRQLACVPLWRSCASPQTAVDALGAPPPYPPAGHPSPPKGTHLEGWITWQANPPRALVRELLVRPLRQAPRLDTPDPQGRAARALPPRQGRQGPAEARDRPHPRGAAGPGRLPHRDRPGLRHRRGRDGDVVAARARARSRCSPGRASARAGSRTR